MNLKGNREYKASFYAFLFGNPEGALELYNALNDTNYTDISMLEINTLKEGLYIGFKNDVSFLLNFDLNLYEHQSTMNPNMPLRGLFYFASLYQKILGDNKHNIYGKKLISLPTPQYVVFCNDRDMKAEREDLFLSNSFSKGKLSGDLECIAHVLNVNRGFNTHIMEKSKRLAGYSELVYRVRSNSESGESLEASIEKAVDSCIDEGILTEILEQNRLAVIGMFLSDYTLEDAMRFQYEEGKEDGIEIGKEQGIALGKEQGIQLGIQQGIEIGKAQAREESKEQGKLSMLCKLVQDGIITSEQAEAEAEKLHQNQ